MIFLESISTVVNKAGTMYPACTDSKYTVEPDLDNGISMTSDEMNCEVFQNMSWSDREFLKKYVGEWKYVMMEGNASINNDSEWTNEDQLNADLIEATDGMRGL
jgi:hypothetical protein